MDGRVLAPHGQSCLRGCLSELPCGMPLLKLFSVASLGYIVIPSTGVQFRETSEIKKQGDQSRQCSGFFGA